MTGSYVIETIRVSSEFSTLPLVLWRRFGRPMPGLAEDTLARNPGISDFDAFIPVGTEIAVKIETENQDAQRALGVIRLW